MTIEWFAPGPRTILPGMAPGGLVVRVYERAKPGRLLSESRLTPDMDLEGDAVRSVLEVVASGHKEVVLTIFDGDTGLRWDAADYARAGLPPPGSRTL